MSSSPLISVITTFYNPGPFLREAIESVLAQTYDRWEYILVDDGSDDGSSGIARSFASGSNGRIRVVEHPGHRNLGMSASRNLGLRHASGELVATLDADDVWMPGKLKQQVDIMAAHPEAALVYGHTIEWHGWSGAAQREDRVRPLFLTSGRSYFPPALFGPKTKSEIETPSMSNICFRRDLPDRVGGFEESFRGMFEDQCFLAKVFLGEIVYVADECWDKYRHHSKSCVSRALADGTWRTSHLAYLEWLKKYLVEREIESGPAWEAVQTALWRWHHPRLVRMGEYWRWMLEKIGSRRREEVPGSQSKTQNPNSKMLS